MKSGNPSTLKDILNPKVEPIETVPLPSRPFHPEATVDGFSFATHSVGNGPKRRLGFWFKIVAWIFLGCTVLGLIVQAAAMVLSFLYS